MLHGTLPKKMLSILLLILLLGALPMKVRADAPEEFSGRMIYVVYDDSGSMFAASGTPIMRWSQAKYAMEVFAAMMGADDVMVIYPMSLNGASGLTLKGSDRNRVKTIHDMNTDAGHTPFLSVQSASQALEKEDDKYEKWLVIITDGEFDDGRTPKDTAQAALNEYNTKGMKTAYLAIGDDAFEMEENPQNGAYSTRAADGVDVLIKVCAMANQIFQRLILDDRFIEKKAQESILNIDIPTRQIIVFAQGNDVAVGKASINGKAVSPSTTHQVKYSDVVPANRPNAIADETLNGILAIYEPDELFEPGTFSVEVSDAESVEYYYQPGVEVSCGLEYRGNPVNADDALYSGDYEVRMNFVNPLTNTEIESELLQSPEFSLTVENNDTEQELKQKKGSVKLAVGNVTLRALAELPGHVRLSTVRSYTVLPEPMALKLTIEPQTSSYRQDQFSETSSPILLTVTDEETGALLTDEQQDALDLQIEDKAGIRWQVSKGKENSTWELKPLSADNSVKGIETGDHGFAVSASFEVDKQTAFGSAELALSVSAYEASEIRFTIGEPEGEYRVSNLGEAKPMPVECRMVNPVTGEEEELPFDVWNNMELEISGAGLDWEIEKGTETGTWRIAPRHNGGDPIRTSSGDVTIRLDGEAESGEYLYRGSAEKNLYIEPLTWAEWLRILGPRVAAAAGALFLLIGYIKKKRLKVKRLNPRCKYKKSISAKRKINKDFFSVILPYVPEKATVKCNNSGFQCNFPDLKIVATGKNTFHIQNKSLDLPNTRINSEKYDDMQKLRKKNFGTGSFEIVSLDPKTGKRLGIFTFK
ncbi:MAG: VWA domain-containing protein [Lachnospiraceae bacterium]|nr:VWA domain-containing protein [Lachnospiraceae bacterium]